MSLKLFRYRGILAALSFDADNKLAPQVTEQRRKKKKIKTPLERFCELIRLIPRRYFEYLAGGDAQRRVVLRHVLGERA